jgi:CBS domain containing-hemolysin-like protein
MSDQDIGPRPERARGGRKGGGIWGPLARWVQARADAADAEDGDLSEADAPADLVDQAEAFQTLRVDDVMTPRADIVAVEIETPLGEVMSLFAEAEHSRMPVYRETLDDPIGVVHIKDLVKLLCQPAPEGGVRFQPDWSAPVLGRLRREALYIPASMRAADLLLRMQAGRMHMALVIDEFGGVDGLVTLEDLLEAVVGEIEDEHDVHVEPEFSARGPDLWEADARVPLKTLEQETGLELEDDEQDETVDTIAGLVFKRAGRVPQRGEVITHPAGLEFEVLEADPRRIRRLRVRRVQPLGPPLDAAGSAT